MVPDPHGILHRHLPAHRFRVTEPRKHQEAVLSRIMLSLLAALSITSPASLQQAPAVQAPASLQAWSRTKSGLHIRDDTAGSGDEAVSGSVVVCSLDISIEDQLVQRVNTQSPAIFTIGGASQVRSKARWSLTVGGDDLFSFTPHERASDSIETVLHEAVCGMRIGGLRRVVVTANSELKLFDEQSAELEIRLLDIRTGFAAAAFRARQPFIKGSQAFFAASLVSDGVSHGLGLSPGAATAAEHAPSAIDAANRWAAEGLDLAGLL